MEKPFQRTRKQWLNHCWFLSSTSNTHRNILRLSQKTSREPSAFVQAKITQQVEVFSIPEPICLNIGNVSITLPSTTPAPYLAQLLREFIG